MSRKYRKTFLFSLPIVIFLAAWRIVQLKAQRTADAYEVVLRYEASSKLRFVSIDGRDPDVSFLRRFESSKLQIWPVSRGRVTGENGWRATGQIKNGREVIAPLVELSSLRWAGWDKASIVMDQGYNGCDFQLRWSDGRWYVTKAYHYGG